MPQRKSSGKKRHPNREYTGPMTSLAAAAEKLADQEEAEIEEAEALAREIEGKLDSPKEQSTSKRAKVYRRKVAQARRNIQIKDMAFLCYVARVVLRLKIERDAPAAEISRQRGVLARWEKELEVLQSGMDLASLSDS